MYQFKYNSSTEYLDSLELDDLYNINLEIMDADGLFYYLSIQSSAGESKVVNFGPYDNEEMTKESFNFKVETKESKEKTLIAEVQQALRPKKRLKSTIANSADKNTPYAKIVVVESITKEQFDKKVCEVINTYYLKGACKWQEEEKKSEI